MLLPFLLAQLPAISVDFVPKRTISLGKTMDKMFDAFSHHVLKATNDGLCVDLLNIFVALDASPIVE